MKGLSLVHLARVAHTSMLFYEAFLALEAREDAWLSQLAANSFEPGLLDTFMHWLSLACTDSIRCTNPFWFKKGEWPSDADLSSTSFVHARGRDGTCTIPSSHSGHVALEVFDSRETKITITSWPDIGQYQCVISEETSRCHLVLSYTLGEMLLFKISIVPGRNTAEYLSLVLLACKTIAGHLAERGLSPPTHSLADDFARDLFLRLPGEQGESCEWSDPLQVPCAHAARALAAMHCCNSRHGRSLPPLSVCLDACNGDEENELKIEPKGFKKEGRKQVTLKRKKGIEEAGREHEGRKKESMNYIQYQPQRLEVEKNCVR